MHQATSGTVFVRLLGEWRRGSAPAYRELADVVRLLILDGRLPLDSALPSERTLALALGVSRTTVTAAYNALREEGYLSAGQGTRARTSIPSRAGEEDPWAARADYAPGLRAPHGVVDFAYACLPANGAAVHQAYTAALSELPALLPGFGYDSYGLPELREAIAAKFTAEGLPTTVDQVMVTGGAQQAMALALAAFVTPGSRVLVNTPVTRTRWTRSAPGSARPSRSRSLSRTAGTSMASRRPWRGTGPPPRTSSRISRTPPGASCPPSSDAASPGPQRRPAPC